MGGNMALKSLKNILNRDLTEKDKIRFENKFQKKSEYDCWEWMAFKNKKGYGAIMYRDLGNIAAHRFSYLLYKGDFDQKKFICHSCDNPSCVNPSHLFVGTASDNMKDKINKGRAKNPPIHKGVECHTSKLNPDIVREIRIFFENGVSQTELAKRYGLHIASMHQICRRKSWKDVK